MKKPPEEKGVSVESAIRVTINGQTFELSKAESTKLRDQLDAAVGKVMEVRHVHSEPPKRPPQWEDEYRRYVQLQRPTLFAPRELRPNEPTCTGDPPSPLHATICHSLQ